MISDVPFFSMFFKPRKISNHKAFLSLKVVLKRLILCVMKKVLDISGLKAAVFDWDNTLAESRSTLVYAVNQVLPQYGLEPWDKVCHKRDPNLSFRDNFPLIFGKNAQEAYEKYAAIYLQNVRRFISAFPKTREVLEFLKNRGVKLMIMTNKDRRLLEYELPLIFNPDLFDNIVCGHEAKADKPDGNHLIFTLKDFMKPAEICPESVWVVGDSSVDSLCALNAGARAIRIGLPIFEQSEQHEKNVLYFDSFVDFYENLLLSETK